VSAEEAYVEDLGRLWREIWPAEVPPNVAYPFGDGSLVDYLRVWAMRRPFHPALIYSETVMTFRELDDLSDRLAGYLVSVLPGRGHGSRSCFPTARSTSSPSTRS